MSHGKVNNSELRVEKEAMTSLKITQEQNLKDLNTKIDKLILDNGAMERRVETLLSENERLKNDLLNAERRNMKIQKKHDRLRKEYTEYVEITKGKNETIANLQKSESHLDHCGQMMWDKLKERNALIQKLCDDVQDLQYLLQVEEMKNKKLEAKKMNDENF